MPGSMSRGIAPPPSGVLRITVPITLMIGFFPCWLMATPTREGARLRQYGNSAGAG